MKLCINCGGVVNEDTVTRCPCCSSEELSTFFKGNEISEIVTHNGKFHTDELASIAITKCLFPKAMVIRSRDEDLVSAKKGRVIIDVGGIYDPNSFQFDHHQLKGIESRRSIPGSKSTIQIKYSSLGLIWEKFGYQYIYMVAKQNTMQFKDEKTMVELFNHILKTVVFPIDISDNTGGIKAPKSVLTLQSIVNDFNTWTETEKAFDMLINFIDQWFKIIVVNAIKQKYLESFFQKSFDTAILNGVNYVILDRCGSWIRFATTHRVKYESIEFVIFKDDISGNWKVQGVPIEPMNREVKKKINPNAIKLDGVTFIHSNQFIAETTSQEVAIKVVELSSI